MERIAVRRHRRASSGWLWAWLLVAAPLAAQPGIPVPGGDTVRLRSISQYGITWTFSQQVDVGRFVTGDYYVVGPATVIGISPAYSGGRNGSMLNPKFGRYQGYDAREGESFRTSLVAKPPISLVAGDVLISTRSRVGDQQAPHVMTQLIGKSSYGLLTHAAILTCVDAARPNTFRPPYVGPRRTFRTSALRWGRLPRLAIAGSLPSTAYWERVFERPWIDHLSKVWLNRYIHPTENMPDYGREMTLAVGMASLVLASDISNTEKQDLLYSFVQYGIDTWGIAKEAGPNRGWEAMGGHGNGRKWPMIFAGLMLDDAEILGTRAVFSEDQQTYYGNGWNGTRALYRHQHPSIPQSVWTYETRHPRTWQGSEARAEGYRRSSTSVAWAGQALVARAMNGIKAWNHPAFFDYVDRWMEEPDKDDRFVLAKELKPKGIWRSEYEYYGQAASGTEGWKGTTVLQYPWSMWRRHRRALRDTSLILSTGFEEGDLADWSAVTAPP